MDEMDEQDDGLMEVNLQAEVRQQSPKLIHTKICGIEIETVWDDEDECFATEDSNFGIMELSNTPEDALMEHFKIAQFILDEMKPKEN